jgi:hypothetical protein
MPRTHLLIAVAAVALAGTHAGDAAAFYTSRIKNHGHVAGDAAGDRLDLARA